MAKKVNFKQCKECGKEFEHYNSLQVVCSTKCAAIRAVDKVWKKERKVMQDKARTRTEWLNLLQVVFNSYIRERDKHLPCISCGTSNNIQYHAGHYFSVGSYPALRFNEDNVHKQCVQCNNFLHGNLVEYDRALKVKIGLSKYADLYALKTSTLKLNELEIKELIQTYKLKLKELK